MSDEASPLWIDHGNSASLRGMHCASCGTTFFPPQSYGCTTCGAFGDRLQPVEMAGRGRLVSFATVYRHHSHEVPFTLGDVELEAGPVVRAELDGNDGWTVGLTVEGRVVEGPSAERLEFVASGVAR